MENLGELFQTADWKAEKHVPVIEAAETVGKGEMFNVTLSIGKEVAHPNTTVHHIRWVGLYFHAAGEKFPVEIGTAQFTAHGESAEGADKSTIYTHHGATFTMKTDKPGTLLASSYCNIHGLWRNAKSLNVK